MDTDEVRPAIWRQIPELLNMLPQGLVPSASIRERVVILELPLDGQMSDSIPPRRRHRRLAHGAVE